MFNPFSIKTIEQVNVHTSAKYAEKTSPNQVIFRPTSAPTRVRNQSNAKCVNADLIRAEDLSSTCAYTAEKNPTLAGTAAEVLQLRER